ncbi:protein MIZU-KUSSEI 1-like [Brassica rapa]|uniref:protein MIZU-KUSSEI 1-like n=1 Tax=Brassica campestris TaxID=3711 RepID=UPI0006AAC948|nr:protein MIZU-KUSSEI 1-like [Brassica rapa]XP_033146145.1 protein MIZU-KUSSEI 1-like [Brassica rapa]XP_033146146.1 protein MIZU-KUSSEI 1-like [Brassica rapa]XP_033146147.1 protein MIZU-KUSSEI 1-like [Brassica rapa]XP_033146148.1 protein MIZU-KUSSEI 1-like [Brassica rapa]XP_033146149.1 protein MIZU-KUSSEI 1-like [Brassica rapa]XP_033146150.1 protein MIZU-KUSSEI 1-like [Brassica rapa]XP_033146151.1 protein MIZU-KUSSEI 1-like [Brassica rapa]XP_033146152.1 protein MIZU-KUSSEI 1-like [Brassica
MMQYQELALQRSFSFNSSKINPANSPARGLHARSPSSTTLIPTIPHHELFLVPCRNCSSSSSSHRPVSSSSSSNKTVKVTVKLPSFLRSLMNLINLPTCNVLSLPSPPSSTSSVSNQLISLVRGGSSSLGRRVTGTLYGHRRGHVTFSVQYGPRSDPALLLDLAMSTATLVKEMASGLVRIALECEKRHRSGTKLFQEPKWTMYCNGRKCGAAVSRGGACTESDWRVLNTVSRVTVGAGVIPTAKSIDDVSGDGGFGGGTELGELLYMRGRFERVVGSRDSEAFYMMNPDKNGGPELSIFLLRI